MIFFYALLFTDSPHSQHFFTQCRKVVPRPCILHPIASFHEKKLHSPFCLIPCCVFLPSTLQIPQKSLPCKSDQISVTISLASSVFHLGRMRQNRMGASDADRLHPSLPLWMLLEKQDVSELPTGFSRTPVKCLGKDVVAHDFRGRVVFKESRLRDGASWWTSGCDRGFCLAARCSLLRFYCVSWYEVSRISTIIN